MRHTSFIRLFQDWKRLRKTAARCRRRTDHVSRILQDWKESQYAVLVQDDEELERITKVLETEKNHTSEAMQQLVIEAWDWLKKACKVQMDLSSRIKKAFSECPRSMSKEPAGLYELLGLERVIEELGGYADLTTGRPASDCSGYEWHAQWHC